MREPWEMRYFAEQVEPLLGTDAVYLGEVSHERKLELLAGASALLFPIRWNEPFGMVMIEAMACGTPVLAFPEGAAPEVVDDGRTGFLCDDEDAMVEAIGRLGQLDAERLPAGGGGLLLDRPDGGRAHRALRVDDRLTIAASGRADSGPSAEHQLDHQGDQGHDDHQLHQEPDQRRPMK